MSSDDHDDNDQRRGSGDNDEPTRDAGGRWLPGHCPNRKGRPKKKAKVPPDQSDIRIFANTMIDVVSNGQKETMDRRTALLAKMFEDAMKGRVSQQRFLYREFEKNSERLAATRAHYERLIMDWIVDNPDLGEPDFEIPVEVELEMLSLRTLLNHYFPGDYPLDGVPAYDDDEDDDG